MVFTNRIQQALQKGRERAQTLAKTRRQEIQRMLILKGQDDIGMLSSRDLFIAGVALYWGEGFKNIHERRLGFCNSDPYMIRFYLQWLKKVLNVDKKDVIARLTLNIVYKEKTKDIERYWEGLTGIPLGQFTKPFYQNVQWKRSYNTDSYKGVLRVHVKNSTEYLWRVKGWIEGLKLSLPG